MQPVAAGPATGDTWIDARLLDIDHYAARHRDAFIDELVRYHGAPRALAAELLAREDAWSAGDLYFACALGQVSGRPCRTVVTLRERAPAQPWSEIAGQVGAAGVGAEDEDHNDDSFYIVLDNANIHHTMKFYRNDSLELMRQLKEKF